MRSRPGSGSTPPTDVQTNYEYRYRERIGDKRFGVPFHSWTERFDPEPDVRGYYGRSDHLVGHHFDRVGARWLAASEQEPRGRVFIVFGDSFTHGSGLC